MKKKFFATVLPAMLAFLFSGLYEITDGVFVGRNIGDVGLAAINLAYPITAFVLALGTGVGMGGAVMYSLSKGRGEPEAALRYLGGTILMLLISCGAVTLLVRVLSMPLLRLFGARGAILDAALEYIRVIAAGCSLQVLGTGLVPLLRNMGRGLLAMTAMIGGFVTNILLDWLLVSVFPFGMAGAAWATVAGQGVTMLPCAVCLIRELRGQHLRSCCPTGRQIRAVLAVALSPFGLTFSPNVVLILMNRAALAQGGAFAVAAYAVLSYVTMPVQLLMQGVGDGSQPLMSECAGRSDREGLRQLRRLAYGTALIVAAVCIAAVLTLRAQIAALFGASPQATDIIRDAFPYFAAGYVCIAFLRVTSALFYAAERNGCAYAIVYGEPIVLLCLLSVLPGVLGLTGVWLSVPAAQFLIALPAALLLKRVRSLDIDRRIV